MAIRKPGESSFGISADADRYQADPRQAQAVIDANRKKSALASQGNAEYDRNTAMPASVAAKPAAPAVPDYTAKLTTQPPLLTGDKANYQFQTQGQTDAQAKGFTPMATNPAIYQGTSAKGNPSFTDLPSMQNNKFGHTGTVSTLPLNPVNQQNPVNRVQNPLPETPWQSLNSGFQGSALKSQTDSNQASQAIKDSIDTISKANGHDAASLYAAKSANRFLDTLQGNDQATQKIWQDQQQQAQQESQYQRGQTMQHWKDLLEGNAVQQKLGLDSQHLGLQEQAQANDNERLRLQGMPQPAKPMEYKPVVEEITNPDGTVTKSVSAFDPLTGKISREPSKASQPAALDSILTQYNAAISAGNQPLADELKKHYQAALAESKGA